MLRIYQDLVRYVLGELESCLYNNHMRVHPTSFKKFFFVIVLLGSYQCWALTVAIDPGHGGMDQGAVRGDAKESTIVLEVGRRLHQKISQSSQLKSYLTRNSDQMLSLSERVKIAKEKKADVLISLHANAAPDTRAQGIEVFFQNSLPPDEEALYLASLENQMVSPSEANDKEPSRRGDISAIVQDLFNQARLKNSLRLSESLQQKKSQLGSVTIKQAPFYVISKSSMPSVLLELGFLTHPKDHKKLKSTAHQEELAEKIYLALLEYKEKIDSTEAQALK